MNFVTFFQKSNLYRFGFLQNTTHLFDLLKSPNPGENRVFEFWVSISFVGFVSTMAGMSVVLDLLRKNPTLTIQSLQASGFFYAKASAAAAAVSVAGGAPYVYNSLFGNYRGRVALCDAGVTLSDDYMSNLRSASLRIFQNDAVSYGTKEYVVELKPLYSAFELKNLTITTIRSLLLYFLPLLEPRPNLESDDENFLEETDEKRVDYVVPLKKSLKQIAREVTVTTTRRTLEKLSVYYMSQRMAWKLLKDLSKSAMRKAGRQMPFYVYFYSVSKTTLRGHSLAVAASWIVSAGIDTFRTLYGIINSKEEIDEISTSEKLKVLRNKVGRTTLRCGASLIFASIGAGIGAILFRPSTGQWVGCLLGDLAGPFIVSYCLFKSLDPEL